MIRQYRVGIFAALFFLAGFLLWVDTGFADEAEPAGTVHQVEATVVHVDQYAVYAPNLVFYFDTRMDKRKIESMMRAADRLRNKKALITSFSAGDAGKDKRVLLLDIGPAGAEKLSSEKPPREAPEQAADAQEKTREKHLGEEQERLGEEQNPSGDETASLDTQSGEQQDSSRQAVFQKKKLPRPGEETASTDTKSGEPRGALKQPPFPEKKLARPGEPAPITARDKPGQKHLGEEQKPLGEGQPPRREESASIDTKYGEPQGTSKQTFFPAKQPPLAAEVAPITRDEVTKFVHVLLELNGMKDLSAVMPFYADKVDYYDRGLVTREDVRKDLSYYFRNWDNIATSLEGDVVVTTTDQPEIRIATFISSFSVRNKKKALAGKTENNWKVQKIDGKLRLIGVKQRIISRELSAVQ